MDCLKKLSKTLTHLVWVLTDQLIRVTDLLLEKYSRKEEPILASINVSNTIEPGNNISIRSIRKPRQLPGEEDPLSSGNNQNATINVISVTDFTKLLKKIMINTKTKVIKLPYQSTTNVYLGSLFNDL